ncbi:MAG: polysaccharide biosynthesis C-terminal domain-containing protein [Bacteroidales bacterium]|jgi:O-antigen/teichoic acid export membrane protein|nr:polysaccharide biosynthesis C-terminal domain-containing protein [Bacteroidales bacterium]
MSNLRQLISQTAIYGVPTIVGRFLNFLLVPLYTRCFLDAEYGVITEMYAYVAFFTVILTLGLETGFFRYYVKRDRDPEVLNSILLTILMLAGAFLMLGLCTYRPLAGIMGYADHPEYLLCFVIVLTLDTLTAIPFAKLRNDNKALRFAVIKIINILANIGFNLFFIVLCPYLLKNNPESIVKYLYNPLIGVGYVFLSNLLASIVQVLCFVPNFIRIKLKYNQKLMREILIYSLPVMVLSLAGIVNETFDRALLKYLLPKDTAMSQLGIYGACYKVAILMNLFIQAFRYAAEPFFFKKAKEGDKNVMEKATYYFFITCLFIFLVCTLFLNDIMLFVGKDFREGAKVVPILLLANIFLGLIYNLSIWYKNTDKTKIGMWISILGAGITVILNFVLIPRIGYMGAAWATLICYVTMAIVSYVLGQKYYPISYKIGKMSLYFLLALILFFVNYFLIDFSPFINRIIAAVMLLVFVLFLLIMERKKTAKAS